MTSDYRNTTISEIVDAKYTIGSAPSVGILPAPPVENGMELVWDLPTERYLTVSDRTAALWEADGTFVRTWTLTEAEETFLRAIGEVE
jgi:hypothetical protein